MTRSPRRAVWRGALNLYYDHTDFDTECVEAPAVYAALIRYLAVSRRIEYGELTFFGDTRYCLRGRIVRKTLDRAAESLFRSRLRMPVDVYEGPAMNHSYHEMIIGHGKCFSTVLFSEKQDPGADYHAAQFLSTKLALERRGRAVAGIVLKDLSEKSLAALDDFFHRAAGYVKHGKV